MQMPDKSDLTFLFEGDRQRLREFVEKYEETLQKVGVIGDIEEMANDYTVEEQIPIVFSFVFGVTVDWREYDDEIVRLFGENMPGETVEVETTDDGLLVSYNGTPHPVRLSFSPKDRYITIRAFNAIIKPKYEIRLFEGSYMSDTHDFLVLPKTTWEELEAKYPAQVAETFRVIDEALDFP